MYSETGLQKMFARLWQEYQNDWVFFVEHALGHATWSKQREIIWSVQNNPRTACQACHGSSKTFSGAEIIVTHYNLFPDAMGITTAPIFAQVEKLLWSEINNIYQTSRAQLKGRILTTEIKDKENPRHYAYGFSTDQPQNAEGWHAWNILFVFDEAKGIAQWMWDSTRGACTGGNAKWLVISTTDGVEIGSEYWKCFQPGAGWNTIHISAYDTPFVTGEKFRKLVVNPDNPFDFYHEEIKPENMRIQLADKNYIEENKDPLTGFGEGSVLYNTKVLGMIVDQGPECVIKLSSVLKMYENYKNPAFPTVGKKKGGIDCAWGGSNDTVCFKAHGLKIVDLPLIITTADLPQEAIVKYQCDQIEKYYDFDILGYELRVDADGGGIAIASELQARGWTVIFIHNGRPAIDNDKYADTVSEIWYETRDIMHEIACPQIDRLTKELTQRKWYGKTGMDKSGRQKIEPKDVYMSRGLPSPDVGDAFMNCVARLLPAGYVKEGREL